MTHSKLDLQQFSGSETFYRHPTGITYTEGVKYLADEAKAYWLIDAIASYQLSPKVRRDRMLQEMQFWTLRVNPDNSAVLICERDTNDPAFNQRIKYIDFPLQEIKLYLANNTLMLPTEY